MGITARWSAGCPSMAARTLSRPVMRNFLHSQDAIVVAGRHAPPRFQNQKILFRPVARDQLLEERQAPGHLVEFPVLLRRLVTGTLFETAVGFEAGLNERDLPVRAFVGGQLFIEIAAVVFAILLDQLLEGVPDTGPVPKDLFEIPAALQPTGRAEIHAGVGVKIRLVPFTASHQ